VLVLVLYPIVLIVLNSFQVDRPAQSAGFSLEAWRVALSNPGMVESVWNTLALTVARQAIAIPTAILLAWILARSDIPGSYWLEFLFWIAYFLPTLPVVLGWIMLLQPDHGLLNQWVAALPFGLKGPFNIYSFWGVVWAHLASGTIAVEVMLLTPAFRNMDASLEEAARISGASTRAMLLRIVLPIMTPVVLVVTILSIIHSLQAFEVELILGFPIRLFVFSTQIYSLLRQDPPLFPEAMALSSIILGFMLPLIVLQRWATQRRSFATVSGRFRVHRTRLGRWRLPVFLAVLAVALTITVVPLTFLVMTTFMKLAGFFNVPQPWTTDQWGRVLGDSIFLVSVRNTLVLAGGSALTAVVLFTAIAYVVVRTRFVGRSLLDFVSWLPVTLPGIILGLGLLWLFLRTPLLRPLYGSVLLLITVTVISAMTLGVQIIKSTFIQLSAELEEAALMSGATAWGAFRRVLLPLITPTLLLVAAVSFISAARNVSTVALLATSSTRPLSLLQLDFMVEGRPEAAAVVGVIIAAMTAVVALLVRLLGLRNRLA
jgi:iron(III) transport system permease protein